ncbi:MAG: glycine cleavage system protein GcvH [Candidatus Omnitrophica bacterium]|nr:glycine cleavage system protein GcvH [Candidatus Omnitrophota bacterium]
MNVPEGLLYTKEHEWAKIEGNLATVGITDYAQHSLGDITFVELPKIGNKAEQSKYLSTVESVKAASDVYAPFSGKIVKVNEALSKSPEFLNQSPYKEGWIAVVEIQDLKEKDNLMAAAAYSKYLETLSK